MPKYKIPELKLEIQAKDQEDFGRKKQIILDRNTIYNIGGYKTKKPVKIKEF